MLTCCVCQEAFNERNTLEMHISTQHIYYNAYECEHCKTAQFPSDFALRLHYKQDHRQKVYYVKYRVSPELQKKKIVLDRLLRISLQNSGGVNAIESASNSGDADEFVQNLDHMEVSQLLNYVNQSALAAQSSQQPSTSFSAALLKYDVDETESVESPSNAANTNTEVVSILDHNNQQQRINVSSQESNNIVYFPINSSYVNGGNKAHDAAVQGLLSINNSGGGHSLTPTITSTAGLNAVHQLQIHANLLQQSPHQQQNGHHQIQQQQLTTYTLNNNNNNNNNESNNNHFGAVQVSTTSNTNNSDDGALSNGTNGQEILAKLINQAVPKREKQRSGTRGGRVSSQISCNDCGHKVSNYMNSLVLHVSTHHCDDVVYECLGCNKQWFSLSARCKEHIKTRHGGDNALLKDNRAKIMPMLKEKAAKFFPEHRFS